MKDLIRNTKTKFIDFLNDGKNDLKKIKQPKDLVKQIPNFVSTSRLFIIPFIIGNILSGNILLAGVLTAGASVTDMIDGFLARKLEATSDFGAKLDAVIDKIFITSISVPLFITNPGLALPVLLDIGIAGINGYAHVHNINVETSNVGKLKTASLDALIITSLLSQFSLMSSVYKVLYFTTIFLQGHAANEYYTNYQIGKKKKSYDNIFKTINEEEILFDDEELFNNIGHSKKVVKSNSEQINDLNIFKERLNEIYADENINEIMKTKESIKIKRH